MEKGWSFFSDRAFKVIGEIDQYHSVPIIRGLSYQLILPQTLVRENSLDYYWVTQALAWHWTQQYIGWVQYQVLDARKRTSVKTFSFFPSSIG